MWIEACNHCGGFDLDRDWNGWCREMWCKNCVDYDYTGTARVWYTEPHTEEDLVKEWNEKQLSEKEDWELEGIQEQTK